jgi:hypothetical protein
MGDETLPHHTKHRLQRSTGQLKPRAEPTVAIHAQPLTAGIPPFSKPMLTGYCRLSGGDEEVRLIRPFPLVDREENMFSLRVMGGGGLQKGKACLRLDDGYPRKSYSRCKVRSFTLACMLMKCLEL